MSEKKEYEIEIEFEGRIYITVEASSPEEAKEKANAYNPKAEEVRHGVETFTVDPWDRIGE